MPTSDSWADGAACWRRTLVTIAGVRDGEAILDVGSGTGALTVAAAAAAPSSRVVGIDVTEPYVAYARARHSRPLIAFEVGDAQKLRFATDTFDRTLSLLVVNFIPDPARALDEMIRVTKPGGTVTAAVWDYGQGMEMLRVFWDEAIAIRPDLDARDERHQPLCRRGELGDLWRRRGLLDVKEEALTIATTFASFDDYWLPFLEKQGPAGAFVAALPEVDRDRVARPVATSPAWRRSRSSNRAHRPCVGRPWHRRRTPSAVEVIAGKLGVWRIERCIPSRAG